MFSGIVVLAGFILIFQKFGFFKLAIGLVLSVKGKLPLKNG
jgi:hypothetical protein